MYMLSDSLTNFVYTNYYWEIPVNRFILASIMLSVSTGLDEQDSNIMVDIVEGWVNESPFSSSVYMAAFFVVDCSVLHFISLTFCDKLSIRHGKVEAWLHGTNSGAWSFPSKCWLSQIWIRLLKSCFFVTQCRCLFMKCVIILIVW